MLTISCIPSNFCAFNIINRKMARGDVRGGHSNLLSSGIFPVIFQLTFGVHVYIVAADAYAPSLEQHRPATRLGDVALRTCVSFTCVLSAGD